MGQTVRGLIRHAMPAVAWLLVCAGANVAAQTAPAAGQIIPGAQLQAWLEGGFSYAGVNRSSQCVLLNVAQGGRRMLFLRCPNGWAEKLEGTARVVGDTYCTRFPIPNTPPGEDCVTWHSLGDWRFEQRKGDVPDTVVIVLPAGLVPPAR